MFECGKPDETNNHVGITPLQASDFASWELLKVVVSGKEAAPFDDLRVSLQKLSKAVPVSWTKYEPKDFEKLVELGNIKRRTGTRAVRNMDGDL
jgi:hypothetical protein